jgi:hypothetical protein
MDYRIYTKIGRKLVFSAISTMLIFVISLFCFPNMHKAFKLAILIASIEQWAIATYYHKTPAIKYVNATRTPVLDAILFIIVSLATVGFVILGILNVEFQIVFRIMLVDYILAYIVLICRKHSEKQQFMYMFVPLIIFVIIAIKQFTS